jgi:F0F1-type ATP synthase epsilon subunit
VLINGQFVEVTSFKAGLLQNSAAQAAQGRERDRQQAAKAEQQLREQEAAEQEKASASESTAAPGE